MRAAGRRRLGSRGVRPPAAGSRGSARGPYPGPLPGSFPAENRAPEPSAEAKRLLQELFDRLHARTEFRSVEVAGRCRSDVTRLPPVVRFCPVAPFGLNDVCGAEPECLRNRVFRDRMSGREAHGS